MNETNDWRKAAAEAYTARMALIRQAIEEDKTNLAKELFSLMKRAGVEIEGETGIVVFCGDDSDFPTLRLGDGKNTAVFTVDSPSCPRLIVGIPTLGGGPGSRLCWWGPIYNVEQLGMALAGDETYLPKPLTRAPWESAPKPEAAPGYPQRAEEILAKVPAISHEARAITLALLAIADRL